MMKICSFLCLILLVACKTPEKILSKSEIKQIEFGGGGGFTGHRTAYLLTENSELFKGDEKLKSIPIEKTADFFSRADKLKDFKHQQSGNIYHFLNLKTVSDTHQIIWTIGKEPQSEDVLQLYTDLQNLTK